MPKKKNELMHWTQQEINVQPVHFLIDGQKQEVTAKMVWHMCVHGRNKEYVTLNECTAYLNWCIANDLNPFRGDAYIVKYQKDEWASFLVAASALRRKAELHPQFKCKKSGLILQEKGSGEIIRREGTFYLPQNEVIVGGWCKIWRQDQEEPIITELTFKEYNKGKANWSTMPGTMMEKCTVAAADRKTFPAEVGSLYSIEEMPNEKSQGPTTYAVPDQVSIISNETAASLDLVQGEPVEPIEESVEEAPKPDPHAETRAMMAELKAIVDAGDITNIEDCKAFIRQAGKKWTGKKEIACETWLRDASREAAEAAPQEEVADAPEQTTPVASEDKKVEESEEVTEEVSTEVDEQPEQSDEDIVDAVADTLARGEYSQWPAGAMNFEHTSKLWRAELRRCGADPESEYADQRFHEAFAKHSKLARHNTNFKQILNQANAKWAPKIVSAVSVCYLLPERHEDYTMDQKARFCDIWSRALNNGSLQTPPLRPSAESEDEISRFMGRYEKACQGIVE